MIPPKIHYCWFGGGERSPLLQRCIESWARVMPEYPVKEWNETNSPPDNAYTRATYAARQWSRLSNYIRLHALYTEGGIYLDTDVEVIRSFTPLLTRECFVGFQQPEEDVDWVNNAVVGAERGHHYLRLCMERTLRLYEEEGIFYRGPAVATAILKEWGLRSYGLQELCGVTICPAEYFYPYPWFGKFSPDCIKETTYCVHHWAGSWLEPEKRVRQISPRRLAGRVLRALKLKA